MTSIIIFDNVNAFYLFFSVCEHYIKKKKLYTTELPNLLYQTSFKIIQFSGLKKVLYFHTFITFPFLILFMPFSPRITEVFSYMFSNFLNIVYLICNAKYSIELPAQFVNDSVWKFFAIKACSFCAMFVIYFNLIQSVMNFQCLQEYNFLFDQQGSNRCFKL